MYPNFSGQVFGEYELLNPIGRGGMAVVYRARQATLNRDVAIKIMSAQLTGQSDFAARFKREADLIAKLEHPHILPIYTYGQYQDFLYLVCRLMDGGSLDRLVMGKALPLADIDRLVGQVASALDYAHAHGIVHRDLKPNNILLDKFGNAYLMDFGIAKILGGTQNLTSTSTLMGTPAYMAPEQWKMSAIDHRADIYSLGIIVYEMLTGQTPFDANTPHQLMYAHLHTETPLPSGVIPGLLPGIDTVIRKSTAKEASERYGSAKELADALSVSIKAQTVDVRGDLMPLTMRHAVMPSFTPITHGDAEMMTFKPANTPNLASPNVLENKGTEAISYHTIPITPVPPLRTRRGLIGTVIGVGVLALAIALAMILNVFGGDDEAQGNKNNSLALVNVTETLSEDSISPSPDVIETEVGATVTFTQEASATPRPSLTATQVASSTATNSPMPTVDEALQAQEMQLTIDAIVNERLSGTQTATAQTLMPTDTATATETVTPIPTPTNAPTLTRPPTNPPLPTNPPPPPTRAATATSAPIFFPAPTATSPVLCINRPASMVMVGMRARTTFTDGSPTNLRNVPNGSQIIKRMNEGLQFEVVGGPVCAGDYTWWQLRLPSGEIGWAAEGEPGRRFLEPMPGVEVVIERVVQIAANHPNFEVYAEPSLHAELLANMVAGDRLAWEGVGLIHEGSTWASVQLYTNSGSSGIEGYIMYRPDWLLEVNPRQVTSGMAIGARVRVLVEGDLGILRIEPNMRAYELQRASLGTTLEVVGGPIYANYFMWWKYRSGDGTEGWMVDIPNWFEVLQ